MFEFEDGGEKFRYSNEVPAEHLWLPSGSRVLGDIGIFEAACGVLEGMKDTDEVWHYIDPTGDRHECLLKLTGFQLEIATQESSIVVKCKYYHSPSGDYQTIFYQVNYEAFLLLPNHLLDFDVEGNVEDIDCFFGGDAVEVTRA